MRSKAVAAALALSGAAAFAPSPLAVPQLTVPAAETITVAPVVANPHGKAIAAREKGTFASNLGWTEAVQITQGVGTGVDMDSVYAEVDSFTRHQSMSRDLSRANRPATVGVSRYSGVFRPAVT